MSEDFENAHPAGTERLRVDCRPARAAVRIGGWGDHEALFGSRRQLETLLANLPGMAYRCRNDENWTMEFVSEGCLDLTGHKAEDLLQNRTISYADLIVAEDRPLVWAGVQAALAEIRPFQLTYRIRTAAGEVRWVWEKGRGVFAGDGTLAAIEGFISDVTEKVRAAAGLEASERKFRELADSLPQIIFDVDMSGAIRFANRNAFRKFGYAEEDLASGLSIFRMLAPGEPERAARNMRGLLAGETESVNEYEAMRRDGSRFPVMIYSTPTFEDGKVVGFTGIVADISERKRAEEAVRTSLKEKEVLLREVHHRVKNNMQVIVSLLNLQAKNLADPAVREIFMESRNRIRSMALVHERLYQSADLSRIDFRQYLERLTTQLFHSYGLDSGRVELRLDVDEVRLDVTTAVPLGLIVNELVSNAIKHAFSGGRAGSIAVRLERLENGRLKLSVADDGVGFPEDIDFRNTESLGMQIVAMLSEQLDGALELDSRKGTAFLLTFNELRYRERI